MKSNKDFWNSRVDNIPELVTSNDLNLNKLEISYLKNKIDELNPSSILDAGCGNGITFEQLKISKNKNIEKVGFDQAEKLIEYANRKTIENTTFFVDTILNTKFLENPFINSKEFELIYTKRVIQNLNNFENQLKAINILISLLSKNGTLILIESFIEPFNNINSLRKKLKLDLITEPWYNNYINAKELLKHLEENYSLNVEIVPFASTYYYFSRIVNAKLNSFINRTPEYKDFLNKLGSFFPNYTKKYSLVSIVKINKLQ